jgi:hypothetical protein
MGKTLFAVVAAGGGVGMGLTTGAMVGSAKRFLTFPSAPFAQCAGCGADDNRAECSSHFPKPTPRGAFCFSLRNFSPPLARA